MVSRLLWIALFGALGAVSRYGVSDWIANRVEGPFPWATFAVNVTGSFALGLAFTLMAERVSVSSDVRAAITIGFLGSYTTFSTFALDTQRLAEDGDAAIAVAYVLASVAATVAAVWTGTVLVRS